MLVSSYLVLRLALLVRQEGIGGAAIWVSDIQNYIMGLLSAPSSIFYSSESEKRPPTDLATRKNAEPPVKQEPPSSPDTLRPDIVLTGEGTA